MADKKTEAQIIQENLDALKDHVDTEEEKALINAVEEARITLVDEKDVEYEYIILDKFELNGSTYLALASCDEKNELGGAIDATEGDDITVVRQYGEGDQVGYSAITDDQELLSVSRVVTDKFGHLMLGLQQ